MAAELVIRPATLDDRDTVVDYNRRLAEESEGKQLPLDTVRPGVAAILGDPTLGRYYMACREGRTIGQTMITFEWSDWRNGQIWWIQSVYVAPEERRGGVFRAMFEHVRQTALREQVVGLRLYVERNNEPALAVYQKMGMENAGYLVFEQMFQDI